MHVCMSLHWFAWCGEVRGVKGELYETTLERERQQAGSWHELALELSIPGAGSAICSIESIHSQLSTLRSAATPTSHTVHR